MHSMNTITIEVNEHMIISYYVSTIDITSKPNILR